jgi:hypothetical protein
MMAKYGQFYIIIGQDIASRGILFVQDERYCLALINPFRTEPK